MPQIESTGSSRSYLILIRLLLNCNCNLRDLEFDLENDKMRCLKGLNYNEQDVVPPGVLRVTQIFDNPQFTIDGADAVDIVQGKLGDCYFLSAMATITTSKGLIEKLCVEVSHFLYYFDMSHYYKARRRSWCVRIFVLPRCYLG